MNFVFVGSDDGRRFFEDQEVNVSQFLFDYETHCR